VREMETMEQRLASSIATPRRLTWLLGAFASAAVLLAALGVFGVMSYVVAQQRRDIGVRLALGAGSGDVVGMVVRRGLARAAAGLVAGVALSLAGARVLRSVLFDVSPTDPVVIATAVATLLGVALAACWIPGRRAARIQPVEVMAGE
jgi:ABC-type antimicrobial peptide transport system permease subunit